MKRTLADGPSCGERRIVGKADAAKLDDRGEAGDRGGGGGRAAVFYTLITTAKLNGLDPEAWLADVIDRIADHPASRIGELLPWNWRTLHQQQAA